MKIRAAEIPKQERFSFGHNHKQNQIKSIGDSTVSAATATATESSMTEHKESEEQKQEENEKEEINKRVSDSPHINESELRSSNPHHEAGPNLETLAVSSSLLLHHCAGTLRFDQSPFAFDSSFSFLLFFVSFLFIYFFIILFFFAFWVNVVNNCVWLMP